MNLEYESYKRIIQKDVNNYIMVMDNGKIKRKGSYVKSLSPLDNDLPIVNKAIVDYFTKNISPADTILNSKKMIDFQKITKVSHKYEYAVYNGETMNERVFRTFSTIGDGGTLYKQHKEKEIGSIDKTAGTPENCVIVNEDITEMETPCWLDRQWYLDLAEKRIKDFLGE
jgi:hypothetical protein